MNKWVIIKIAIFIVVAVTTFLESSQPEVDVPLVFSYLIIAPISFLVSLAYFKGVSKFRKLTIGNMATFSFKILYDPLPFYHIVAIVVFISGCCGILRDVVENNPLSSVDHLRLAVALGLYPSILIANKRFIVEQPRLRKV